MAYPEFGFETTAEEAGAAFAEEIKGKNVLITGTSQNGIGFEVARVLAKYAGLLIITGYSQERLKLSESAIKAETPSANIRILTLDLNSLAATRSAAAEVLAYPEPLHVLINNASAPLGPFATTADGFEAQIGVGHVGAFLFTKLITPKLLASSTSTYTPRVLFTASQAHAFGPGVNLETALKRPATGEGFIAPYAYFAIKSANVLFASELARRAKGKLLAFSYHPGLIVTNLGTKEPAVPVFKAMGLIEEDGSPTKKFPWKSIPQGAATTIVTAFDPRLVGESGAYLNDSKIQNELLAPHTSDPATAAKLWDLTEEALGEKYEF
ncbi:Short-chain dehydrogenase/reductase family protein [Mycena chlorophos]|uniref:Short-chain dehydrogenase/reductase family protein n=1 Tax=Mycena chlorophos TaxID=658473 RepID=A0A8H6TGS9_MYCCL|nr:Short-chain dehydrogenase/reductase family protein [Mycena chlorophos]